MIPMISTLEEIRAARAIIQDCRARLLEEGHKIAERIEIGIMVETPSAALLADKLSKEVDFFSIGTNDLAQYTMAADRTNSSVAALASGYQPAVLRLIAQVIASGHASGIPVALCGGLASEPAAIPILVGFGIDELSINPPDIPAAKQIIRSLVYTEVQELAKAVLEMDTSEQIIDYVNQKIESVRKVRE
jgi:phosphoenolpyruvate-protein kinase (PTS system EI component)